MLKPALLKGDACNALLWLMELAVGIFKRIYFVRSVLEKTVNYSATTGQYMLQSRYTWYYYGVGRSKCPKCLGSIFVLNFMKWFINHKLLLCILKHLRIHIFRTIHIFGTFINVLDPFLRRISKVCSIALYLKGS